MPLQLSEIFHDFYLDILGVPIQLPNLNMFVKKESSILVIKSIKADASDAYSCVATNVAGQDTATTKITVLPQG